MPSSNKKRPRKADTKVDCSSKSVDQIVQRMYNRIASGRPWQGALLTAMSEWPLQYEDIEGVRYQYLLLGEAFDWKTLANRLLDEVNGLVPLQDKSEVLFGDVSPEDLWAENFKVELGPVKYSSYLNYFYGVIVEEALLLAVEEEVRKDSASRGLGQNRNVTDFAYLRIYGQTEMELVEAFHEDTGRVFTGSMLLLELKEFTYWLFKQRVNRGDSSRVASDTLKGIQRLEKMGGSGISGG